MTEDSKIVEIEDKINAIESKTNDIENYVNKAKDEIKKLNEDVNIWSLFNKEMVPYIYEQTFLKLIEKLEEKNYKESVEIFQRNLFWFSWDDFPKDDTNGIMLYLAKKYNIKDLKQKQIEKNTTDKTIKICFENNIITLGLHEEKKNTYLKINDHKANEFVLKYENGKLNIYKKTLAHDIPYPLNKDNCKTKRILESTTFLKNAREFFEAGKIASSDTKPIFYYYSITYLFSFLLDSLVHFEQSKKHHGIYVQTENSIDDIRFTYNESGGLFERVVHTLSMLGYISSFSSFICFNHKNQKILFSQKTNFSISNTNSIKLNELLKHDYQKDLEKLSLELNIGHEGFQRYRKTSSMLRDFILIFVSSAIARYDPFLWREIYSGNSSDLIFDIEKSFNNINDMIRLVNDIIIQGEKGHLLINYEKYWADDFFCQN